MWRHVLRLEDASCSSYSVKVDDTIPTRLHMGPFCFIFEVKAKGTQQFHEGPTPSLRNIQGKSWQLLDFFSRPQAWRSTAAPALHVPAAWPADWAWSELPQEFFHSKHIFGQKPTCLSKRWVISAPFQQNHSPLGVCVPWAPKLELYNCPLNWVWLIRTVLGFS